jgi:YD repeat-containing protein
VKNVPLSETTTSFYNALNQLIETAPPDSSSQLPTLYTYDGAGNELTKTDGSGTAINTYDADNRLVGITYTSTTSGYVQPSAVTYQYDADGNRTKMTDGTGTTTYVYDPLNQLESVTNGASNTVTYAYDPAGNNTCLQLRRCQSHVLHGRLDKPGESGGVHLRRRLQPHWDDRPHGHALHPHQWIRRDRRTDERVGRVHMDECDSGAAGGDQATGSTGSGRTSESP